MRTIKAAAIYARISSDAEGTGKGVERQIEDCRRLAAELGWPIAEEYVDNDISAYTGKHRPNYQRMLTDITEATIDAVLVYNLDRLTRRPVEFEEFNAILSAAGVTDVRFVTGDMDFGTQDGLLIGRIQAAVASNASGKTSERIKRKLDQVAAEGRPHGGAQRPFGFDADKITHRPAEVAIIRQLADRFVAGESLRSLAVWLNNGNMPPSTGDQWRTNVIRRLISSPRSVGLREHRGEIVGPAVWDPILTTEQRDRVLAILEDKKNSGRRAPRRYLLSGLLRCGRCEERLYSAPRKTTRRYVCMAGPDHGGCGRLTVVAGPVEEFIADAVLYRLDTPELAEALAGRARQDEDTARLMERVSADREQLAELAAHYAERRIPMNEWLTARTIIEDRMKANERRLRQATNTSQLTGVIGQGGALRTQWTNLNLDRQSAIVKAILDHAVILPGTPGATTLDHDRVKPVWRL